MVCSRALRLTAVCFALLFLLLAPAPAHAHRVNIFAYVDGGEVVVECGFNRSAKVKQGRIEVFDAVTGARLLQGVTDDNGVFRFPVPEADIRSGHGLRIHINAGEGHQNDWDMDAAELDGASPAAAPPQASSAAPDAVGTSVVAASAPAAAAAPPAPGGWATPEDVERIVDRALNARLAPINRLLAERSEAGPSLADIIGGIGWIFGLVGVAAYFRRRK